MRQTGQLERRNWSADRHQGGYIGPVPALAMFKRAKRGAVGLTRRIHAFPQDRHHCGAVNPGEKLRPEPWTFNVSGSWMVVAMSSTASVNLPSSARFSGVTHT